MRVRDRAALVVVAVLALGAVALLALAAGRPAGPQLADRTEWVSRDAPLPPITAATPVEQPLVAAADRLSRISATFGTFGGVEGCAIQATLTDDHGAIVTSAGIPCASIPDTEPMTLLEFPPVPDSAGRTYTLRLEPVPGSGPDIIALWGGRDSPGLLPARSAGVTTSLAGAVVTEYSTVDDRTDQLGVLLSRVSLGAPWWGQPPAIVTWAAMAALAVLAVVGAAVAGRLRLAVVALAVLALTKGLLWAVLIPPLEGMDEGAHVAYAQFVQVERQVPVRGVKFEGRPNFYSEQISVLTDDMHMVASRPTDRREYTDAASAATAAALAGASAASNGAAPAAGYPPTYYVPAAVAAAVTPGTLVDDIYAMRVWSVLLGVLSAVAAVGAAAVLLPRAPAAAALVGLTVVLQPMASHQFGIVNNDALVIAAGSVALLFAARLARDGPSARWAFAGGLAAGAALLGKPFGAIAVAVVALGWALGLHRAPRGQRGARIVGAVAGGGLGLALSYGPWVVAQRIFGWPSTSLPVEPGRDQRTFGSFWVSETAGDPALWRLRWVEQYWGRFSWVDTPYPDQVNDGLYTLSLLGTGIVAAGLVVVAVTALTRVPRLRARLRARLPVAAAPQPVPQVHPRPLGTPAALLLTVGALVATLLVLYAAGWLYFASSGRNDLLQGRYALLTLPCLVLAPVLALRAMSPRRWSGLVATVAAGTGSLVVLGLTVSAFGVIADRFYF